ncbi:MAG: UDP-N-acetylmuramoyl-L-alanine--D-glutamate ligase [Candidatus Absconditicoccaceae bacterium]
MKISDLSDKKIAILGFGLEGKSSLNFLLKNNINPSNITILDWNKLDNIPQSIKSINGKDYLKDISEYDIILKTAGSSIYLNKELIPVKSKIITQMQLFFDNYKGKIIGVTASKGKSTISTLLYQVIKDAGKNVKFVGNIGIPVLDEIDFKQEYDYVVCEISSYMLEFLNKTNYISILGSIFPEHLDWHNGFENYLNAKLNILDGSQLNIVFQNTLDTYDGIQKQYQNIISYGKNGTYSWEKGFFTKDGSLLFSTKDIKLLGDHNLENICAILTTIDQLGIDIKTAKQTINNFTGLPHRLEFVGTYDSIDFYDDAISTTPESTIQAIKTLNKRIDTIFLGGTDRGYNFDGLANHINQSNIRNIVLFSPSGKKIKESLQNNNDINFYETNDMLLAVDFAFQNTLKGKICLLSTASPSYSIRKNFEEKGNLFKKHINEHFKVQK